MSMLDKGIAGMVPINKVNTYAGCPLSSIIIIDDTKFNLTFNWSHTSNTSVWLERVHFDHGKAVNLGIDKTIGICSFYETHNIC